MVLRTKKRDTCLEIQQTPDNVRNYKRARDKCYGKNRNFQEERKGYERCELHIAEVHSKIPPMGHFSIVSAVMSQHFVLSS